MIFIICIFSFFLTTDLYLVSNKLFLQFFFIKSLLQDDHHWTLVL